MCARHATALRAVSCLAAAIRRPRIGSLAAALFIFVSLSGCNKPEFSKADWSEYAKDTLTFVAPVENCGYLGFGEPRIFYHASDVKRSSTRPTNYFLYYHNGTKLVLDQFEVIQFWKPRNVVQGIPVLDPGTRRCAIIAEIPANGTKPYFITSSSTLEISRGASLGAMLLHGLFLLLIYLLALLVGSDGYEPDDPQPLTIIGACLLSLSIVAGIVVVVATGAEFDKAMQYRAWTELLPKDGSWLLPLSWGQFAVLAAGPPHPTLYLNQAIDGLVPVWWSAAFVWLVFYSVRLYRGGWWLLTSHPLEELLRRATAEQRIPTTDELKDAHARALSVPYAWQHRMMTRKAQAYTHILKTMTGHLGGSI